MAKVAECGFPDFLAKCSDKTIMRIFLKVSVSVKYLVSRPLIWPFNSFLIGAKPLPRNSEKVN